MVYEYRNETILYFEYSSEMSDQLTLKNGSTHSLHLGGGVSVVSLLYTQAQLGRAESQCYRGQVDLALLEMCQHGQGWAKSMRGRGCATSCSECGGTVERRGEGML